MSSSKGANQQSSWTVMAFHASAFSIYGYAICWQNVSSQIAGMAKLIHPGLRPYGKLKFLTYNCLLLQFAAYSLCLASHFVPRLRKTRDYFLTSLAMPVSAIVCICFWGVWHLIGREQIFPKMVEEFYPNWLNHVTHTIILPINLVELYLVRHEYSSNRSSLTLLSGYMATYAAFLIYMRLQSGVFVYGFLNLMSYQEVAIFMAGSLVASTVFFFTGKFWSRLFHGSARGVRSSSRPNKKAN